MIKVIGLTKKYGKTTIVSNLSLSIEKGSIFGFLGPNGAGKTTTIKCMIGLSAPTKGSVKVDGKPVEIAANREAVGFMPEDPYFYDHLSAVEFLRFAKNLFKRKGLDEKKVLELVGLGETKKQRIYTFSKGMKQRLGLAQALINDPEYLFLDEPLDGLDPVGRLQFKKIFLSLQKEGKTIFFNSHILSDVEELCDKIGIIDKGKLVYNGPVKKFCGKKSLEEAFVEKLASK